MHKNLSHLCAKYYRKKKLTIPFTTLSKRIKYLGTHLIKEVKDLYNESFKTLVKETEGDTNEWKDVLCSLMRRINMLKMSILPKAMQRLNEVPTKSPVAFFTEINNTKHCKELQKVSKWHY